MVAECFVISIAFAVGLIVVRKERKKAQRDNWGFKESREAAINVIPTVGFNVNELGDHIPILKLIPITLSCFFNFSPKGRKAPSVTKVKHTVDTHHSDSDSE